MVRPADRRQQILTDIGQIDDNLIPQLSQKYGVSEMTIRRDLKFLENKGYIKRTWGGAVLWSPVFNKPFVLSRVRRQRLRPLQKEAIARYAARHFVNDGDIIIMEGGTTVTAMAPFLQAYRELTVMTNGLYTTDRLQCHLGSQATIICAGGILRPESSTFVGPVAERTIRECHAQTLFLSATGLGLEVGLTDPKMLETQVKLAMIGSAAETIIMLDSRKFGVKSLMTVLALDRVGRLITDEEAPARFVEQLRARGVDVILAPPE